MNDWYNSLGGTMNRNAGEACGKVVYENAVAAFKSILSKTSVKEGRE